jgi:hypothetical protein
MNTALRCTTSAAAKNGLGTTIKYLSRQNAGARNSWAKAHIHKSWTRIQINPPCSVPAFEVTSEPYTGARPSARLCVGPELARGVHLRITFTGQPLSVIDNINLACLPAQWALDDFLGLQQKV